MAGTAGLDRDCRVLRYPCLYLIPGTTLGMPYLPQNVARRFRGNHFSLRAGVFENSQAPADSSLGYIFSGRVARRRLLVVIIKRPVLFVLSALADHEYYIE